MGQQGFLDAGLEVLLALPQFSQEPDQGEHDQLAGFGGRAADSSRDGVTEVFDEFCGALTAAVAVGFEPVRHPQLAEPGCLRFGGKPTQERQADRDVELAEQTDRAGEVVLQHRQELVVYRDPVVDQVVAGPDQHPQRDGLRGVGSHNRPAAGVGAQRISQDEGIEPVVLVARRAVADAQ